MRRSSSSESSSAGSSTSSSSCGSLMARDSPDGRHVNRGSWGKPGFPHAQLAQRLLDGPEDAVLLERLDDEVLRAGADRLDDLGLLAERRAHDDAGGGVSP